MTKAIPKMDQRIINELFPGQVVISSQRSVKSIVRGYVFNNGRALFITTEKGRLYLSALLLQVQAKRKYELEMRSSGSHLICIMRQS